MTARNNRFLHSLKPEFLKKWIFISSSAKGILTCCIMHNFKLKKKRIFKTPLITHSDGIKNRSLNTAQLFPMYRNKWHVSVTISNTETWCSLSCKNCPRYQNYLWLMRTDLLRRKFLRFSLALRSFFSCQTVLGGFGFICINQPTASFFSRKFCLQLFSKTESTQGWNILSYGMF